MMMYLCTTKPKALRHKLAIVVLMSSISVVGAVKAQSVEPVSYTHLTLPTTPYV